MLYFEKVVFNFNIQVINPILQFVLLLPNFKILPFFEVMKRLSNILNVLLFYLSLLCVWISWNWLFCRMWSGGMVFILLFVCMNLHVWKHSVGKTDLSPQLPYHLCCAWLCFWAQSSVHSSIFVPVLHNLNHFLKYYKAKLLTEQLLFMLSFI